MKRIFNYIPLLLILGSCGINSTSNETENLKIIYQSSQIENKPSVSVEKSKGTLQITINFNKLGKDHKQFTKFKFKDGGYYQVKEITNLENKIIDTLYLLSFSTKDTSYVYEYNFNKYPPIIPKGLDDWNFRISSCGVGNYKLLKVNTADANFREEYDFDENFNIDSINIYHGSDTLMFAK